jgi:hypothetical protein
LSSENNDTSSAITLGRVFDALEKNKSALHIQEYCLSQTSLEQIFNFFAAQQDEEHLVGNIVAVAR